MQRLLLLLLLPLGGVACASSGGHLLETRSSAIRLRPPTNANVALGEQVRLTLHAERVCADADCLGRGYYLVVTNTSSAQVYINYRPVRVIADGRTFEWMQNTRGSDEALAPAVGAFVRVPIDEDKLRFLADATDVTLYLGSERFPLEGTQRAGLRAFLATG